MLESARKLCRRFVKLELPSPDSTAILTHAGEDVLVSWGRFYGDSGGISSFLLWDDPVSTSLLLQVPRQTLETPAPLEDLLTGMFAWGEENLESVFIDLSPTTPTGRECIRGMGFFRVVREVALGPQLTISGYSEKTGAWLSITFRKDLGFPFFEHDMMYIAERFPPLRTRVPGWTTAQLLAAAGHGGRAGDQYARPFERDRVLLQELLQRQNLTADDFQDLIDRAVGTGPSRGPALPGVILVAAQSESGARFTPVMLNYFRRLETKSRPAAESEARGLFLPLDRGALPAFCNLAVGFLKEQLAVRESIQFADKFCSSQEAYEAVLSVEEHVGYAKDRSAALDQITKRLAVR